MLILYWPCIESWSVVVALGPMALEANTADLELIHEPIPNQQVSNTIILTLHKNDMDEHSHAKKKKEKRKEECIYQIFSLNKITHNFLQNGAALLF